MTVPAFHIERSVSIDADESRVRAAIEDFAEWPKWSPWLCMEPSARIDAFGTPGEVGHGYDWVGEVVGSGGMKIASNEGGKLKMDLHFLTPHKSNAKVMMEIKPRGDQQTEVTWQMDGKLPIFLFFLLPTMKAALGMDYARGLKMLKEYVETGAVKSKSEFVGIVDVEQSRYLGVEDRCKMDEMKDSFGRTMPAVCRLISEHQLETSGPPGAVYHKVDIKSGACHYAAMVQVPEPKSVDGAKPGSIEPCKAIKVVHTGSYDHVGNAWSTAMAHQRYKKIKFHKSQPMFELYLNDPEETAEEDLVTEIYIPVRG